MTRDEKSLLLYLETCAVDQSGRVDMRKMNETDVSIVTRWNKSGYVKFGRIKSHDIVSIISEKTHWCELSDHAFTDAHAERKARAHRLLENRDYERTSE